jgi:prepilin-type N-terminal cleavage/methylation domain-containing protein
MDKKHIAFTLIELLVVIAIVGILSGLIIVSMGGVTQSATVAKAQVFSNSLRNALLNNLVSEWKFNGDVNDSWGSNNGTLTGATYDTTTKECVYGSCLSFTGTLSEYVQMPAITTLATATPFILSAWVYPIYTATYLTIMGYDTTHRLLIASDGTLLSQQDGGFLSATGEPGYSKWSNILYWNDGTQEKWYVNGHLSGTAHTTANAEWNAAFKVGQYDLVNYPYKGRIDEIRIFNSSISLSQIEEQYYSGLNNLLAEGAISEGEYAERIEGIALK